MTSNILEFDVKRPKKNTKYKHILTYQKRNIAISFSSNWFYGTFDQ